MIRGTVFKILKSKPVYTSIYRLTYIAVFFGMLSAYLICHYGQSNNFEENAVSPKVQENLHLEFVQQNIKKMISEFQDLETQNKLQYNLDTIDVIKPEFQQSKIKVVEYLKQQFEDLQLSTHEQLFQVKKQGGQIATGLNLVGVLYVPRSPNFECNLISFDYSDAQNNYENMALAVSMIKMYKERNIKYMSRNLVFVAYDGQYKKQGIAIQEFLNSYFDEQQQFLRAGVIRQSINLDFKGNFESIVYKVFGLNGRVADQDYILNFNQLLISLDVDYKYTEKGLTGPESRLQQYVFQPFDKQLKKLNLEKTGYIRYKHQVNFSHFFNILTYTIYGYTDDAHSYMYKHGIMSITLAGKGPEHKKSKTHGKYVRNVIQLIEGANRVCMSLDEQLHAGSTLYFPVEKNYSLTVAKYVYPVVIVVGCLVIQALYAMFKQRHYNFGLRVWLQLPIYVLNLFLMLAMPSIIEFILQYLGHTNFQLQGVLWEDMNDPVLNIFIEYLFLGYLAGFLLLNIICELIAMNCCQNYFKPYNDYDRNIFQCIVILYTCQCAIFWLFYTVAFAFLIILIIPIPTLFMYRYLPANKASIVGWIRTILNWAVLYALVQGLIFIIGDYDLILSVKNSVIQYANGQFQGYLFLVSTVINSTLLYIKFYFI